MTTINACRLLRGNLSVKAVFHQAVVGNRPKSIVAELERETRKYHEAHSIASESNLTLHKAMQLHVKNLKLLGSSMEEIQAKVPSLTGLEPSTQASLDDMRAIIGWWRNMFSLFLTNAPSQEKWQKCGSRELNLKES